MPIVAGILVATLANHGLAAAFGASVTALLGDEAMRFIVGLLFLAMAAWTLIPDRANEGVLQEPRSGVLIATMTAFFLAEIGDKTQVATVALAARYAFTLAVVSGTTPGMIIANLPVVLAGERLLRRVPMKAMRALTAIGFTALGGSALLLFSP